MDPKNKKDCKVKIRKRVTWQVCEESSVQSRNSVGCSLDVVHYHKYRQKQQDKIKALEENLLKTQKELDELKHKFSLKSKQQKKKKSKNKNNFNNSALRNPEIFITTCENILKNYANHLQVAHCSSAQARVNNVSNVQHDRNNIVSFTISKDLEDDVQQKQKRESRSISTNAEDKIKNREKEETKKENKSIPITTLKLNKDKKDDVQSQKLKKVRKKPKKGSNLTFTNKEEIRDKIKIKTQPQEIKYLKDVQLKTKKGSKSTWTRTKILIKDKDGETSQSQKYKDLKDIVEEKSKKVIKPSSTNIVRKKRGKVGVNEKPQTIDEIKRNDNKILLVEEEIMQTDYIIDMEPTPEPDRETPPDSASQTNTQPCENVTSNMSIHDMFQGTPNENARRCLEGFSSWANFASHTETGRQYRSWFESSATRPQNIIASSGGRKRKNTSQEEFIDIETYHAFKEMRTEPALPQEFIAPKSPVSMRPSPPLVRYLMPMPPPRCPAPPRSCLRPNPVCRHPNYPAPVFPTPRATPVTSTITSASATTTDERPHFDPGLYHMGSSTINTRSTLYPAQRGRVTRSTGILPRYSPPPTTETDEQSIQRYYNQYNM